MKRSWSLFVRLGAVAALGLFLLQLLIVFAIYAQRARSTEAGFRFPLPDQAAAIVELLETGENRAAVLRAVNRADLIVTVEDAPFEAFETEPRRIEKVERAVARYLDALGGRRAAVFVAVPEAEEAEADARLSANGLWTRHPMRMAIELAGSGAGGGGVVVIETQGELARRIYNWPLGLFSGIIGLVVAAGTLWFLRRETRPIRRLAAAARSFGEGRETPPVRESGARELRSLIRNFNAMRERIGELLHGRTLMLGAMSHDLRTYLTRLRLRVEAIEPEAEREKAVRDVERMSALVDDSLAFARILGEEARVEEVDLAALVREIAGDLDPEGGRVTVEAGGAAVVEGSRSGLRRVVTNLVENALKFGSTCRITLAGADPVVLEIADDGPGIPPGEREAVLRPFWRGDAARTLGAGGDGRGAGLGLAIAREVVTRMGGTLTLGGNTPSGLVCTLTLPARVVETGAGT